MNWIDIVIVLIIAGVLGAIIFRSIRKIKRGETPGCNCGCDSCTIKDSCHKESKQR